MAKLKRLKWKDLKKPDEFVTFWGKVYILFLQRYRNYTISGLLLLFVILISIIGFSYYKKDRISHLNKAIADICKKYKIIWDNPFLSEIAGEDEGVTKERFISAGKELASLCEDFKKTKGVVNCFILSANSFFYGEDWASAVTSYEKALLRGGSELEIYLSLSGIAHSYERMNKGEAALEYFQRIYQEIEDDRLSITGFMESSRILEKMNQDERALQVLLEFNKKYPDVTPDEDLILRMEYLKEKIQIMKGASNHEEEAPPYPEK